MPIVALDSDFSEPENVPIVSPFDPWFPWSPVMFARLPMEASFTTIEALYLVDNGICHFQYRGEGILTGEPDYYLYVTLPYPCKNRALHPLTGDVQYNENGGIARDGLVSIVENKHPGDYLGQSIVVVKKHEREKFLTGPAILRVSGWFIPEINT